MVLELYCNIILKNRQKALKNTLSLIQFIKSLENHRNLELEVLKGSTYYTIQEYLLRRRWHPTPIFLPGKSHGWRSLVGCSPWGREELHTTERLPFHFSLMHCRRKWQPTPVFLPGESQGRRSLVGCCLWGCTESDTTEAT